LHPANDEWRAWLVFDFADLVRKVLDFLLQLTPFRQLLLKLVNSLFTLVEPIPKVLNFLAKVLTLMATAEYLTDVFTPAYIVFIRFPVESVD
jgi:hypothetical protein